MMAALKNSLNQVEATTTASKAATSAAFATTYNTTSNRKTAVTDNTFKYCWTCGYFTQGNGHTGMDFQHPATGHIKKATMGNMQGGNSYIRRRSQERPAKPEWEKPQQQKYGQGEPRANSPIKIRHDTITIQPTTHHHVGTYSSSSSPSTSSTPVRLTNRDYQAKVPTDPFEGKNTHFHIPCGT